MFSSNNRSPRMGSNRKESVNIMTTLNIPSHTYTVGTHTFGPVAITSANSNSTFVPDSDIPSGCTLTVDIQENINDGNGMISRSKTVSPGPVSAALMADYPFGGGLIVPPSGQTYNAQVVATVEGVSYTTAVTVTIF